MKSIQAQKKILLKHQASLTATREKNSPQFGQIQTQILLKDQQANLRATRVKKNGPQFGQIQTQILLKVQQANLRATRVKKCSSNTNKNFAERPGNLRATKNGPQFGQALSDAE